MQYELNSLEKYVQLVVKRHQLDHDEFQQVSIALQNEILRIKNAFIKKAFNAKKDKIIEFYIQYHQESIVQLIDSLLEQQDNLNFWGSEKLNLSEQKDLPLVLYQQLEQLLLFIEKHFTRYFNKDAKSPESYRYLVQRDLSEKISECRYALDKKSVNKKLLTIAFSPLNEFIIEVGKRELTYRKLIYFKELMAELEELSGSALNGIKLDLQLCRALAYLNFNSHKFYKFCTSEISKMVDKQESLTGQIEKLAYLMKLNNQIQVKPDFAFLPKAPSIQQQLSEWISEEINYLEKSYLIHQSQFPKYDEPIQKVFKFRTELSVAQIAYGLKLLIEIGVIKNKNILEVLRFTSSIVQSKKTENIAWGSLRSKYYHPDNSAIKMMKDIAIQCLNLSRK